MLEPILVDMDGVICDFVDGFYEKAKLSRYNLLRKVLPDPEKITTFYIEDSIPPEHLTDEIKNLADDLVNEVGLFFSLKPIENAIEGVSKLEEYTGRKIFFVSAPHPSNTFSYTEKAMWIDRYFGKEWLNRLILTRDKTIINGVILIDDKPNPMGIYTPTWEHVVFDQNYNQNDPFCKGKRRLFSWKEDQIRS
ncbi:MAG: hypothetical protein KGI50_07890, partial [Patescibacteria group bacterium]|nr:hypothetical protein [Patescibacteria group bacterium]